MCKSFSIEGMLEFEQDSSGSFADSAVKAASCDKVDTEITITTITMTLLYKIIWFLRKYLHVWASEGEMIREWN